MWYAEDSSTTEYGIWKNDTMEVKSGDLKGSGGTVQTWGEANTDGNPWKYLPVTKPSGPYEKDFQGIASYAMQPANVQTKGGTEADKEYVQKFQTLCNDQGQCKTIPGPGADPSLSSYSSIPPTDAQTQKVKEIETVEQNPDGSYTKCLKSVDVTTGELISETCADPYFNSTGNESPSPFPTPPSDPSFPSPHPSIQPTPPPPNGWSDLDPNSSPSSGGPGADGGKPTPLYMKYLGLSLAFATLLGILYTRNK